jgi:hypothetical protein
MVGAVIEGFATLLCRLASKTLADKNPKYANIFDSFIGTSLVVAGNLKMGRLPKKIMQILYFFLKDLLKISLNPNFQNFRATR